MCPYYRPNNTDNHKDPQDHQETACIANCFHHPPPLHLQHFHHYRYHTLLDAHRDLALFRYFLDTRPGGEDWAFRRVDILGTIGAVRLRVLEGAGVAVLPHYFVKRDLQSGKLALILPDIELPVDWFRLVWREGHPRDAALRTLAADLVMWPLR